MFRRQQTRYSLMFFAVGVAALLLQQTKAQRPQSTLAGARAAIDAANYGSLQQAIDALPPEGGCVRIPAGRFEIAEPLVIEVGDVLLAGQGTASELVNVNQSGKPCLIVRPKNFAAEPKAALWRVQIADLRLTGNEKSGHGIEALRVNELFVDGITVSYHGGDGVRLDHCYEDPRICDSLISYNKQAGLNLLGCHDIVVSSNQFEENQDAVRCIDSFNLCMTGNNIDDHLRHGVVIENTYGSVVSGNMIEECQGAGIVLDRDCYGITLAANVIAHEFAGGIELLDAHGCTVSANSFPLVHQHALLIGPESDRIAVTGNAFADSYIGRGATKRPVKEDPAGGLTLSGTRDVAVSGNTFSGLARPAVALEGAESRQILFHDNLLAGGTSEHDKLIESDVSDNLVDPLADKTTERKTYTYKTVGELPIKADVYRLPGDDVRPVIVWIHGGGLITGGRGGPALEQRRRYLDAGYVIVSIDYRLAPETKLPGIIEDVRDAIKWVRGKGPELYKIDPRRIAVVGHSAGGYLTLMAGFTVEPRPQALIAFYGYGDVAGDWYSKPHDLYRQTRPLFTKEEAYIAIGTKETTNGGVKGRGNFYTYCRQNGLWPQEVVGCDPVKQPAEFDRFCPVRNVTSDYPPTLLLHGDSDIDVPHQQSVDMAAEFRRAGVVYDFISIQGGGHGFDGKGMKDADVSAAFDRIGMFLRKHVGGPDS